MAWNWVKDLTSPSFYVRIEEELPLALQKLRQPSVQYPLLRLELEEEQFVTSDFLQALAATTTLTSLWVDAGYLSAEAVDRLVLCLKAVPSLRK